MSEQLTFVLCRGCGRMLYRNSDAICGKCIRGQERTVAQYEMPWKPRPRTTMLVSVVAFVAGRVFSRR